MMNYSSINSNGTILGYAFEIHDDVMKYSDQADYIKYAKEQSEREFGYQLIQRMTKDNAYLVRRHTDWEIIHQDNVTIYKLEYIISRLVEVNE